MFVPVDSLKLVVLRKAIISSELLSLSLKLLSMFNICQCLFTISFMFGSTELYVTENGIESLRLGLQFFGSNDLSTWSVLSICFLTVVYSSPFQQIFLLGLGSVTFGLRRLHIRA